MDVAQPAFDYQHARAEGDAVARRGLLELAASLLAEEGPQALTLRTLAQRANCSTKVVYTLFGGKNGLSEGLKVEGFARLRFAVERERRRHRDPVRALLPVMQTYRNFALGQRSLFRVMFGNALPEHVPTDYSRAQARLALGAVASVVAEARSALGQDPSDAHEGAVRLWAAAHGPVTLELEGIPPFSHDGERLARLAVTDLLVSLRLMPISPPHPIGEPPVKHRDHTPLAASAAALAVGLSLALAAATPAQAREDGASSLRLEVSTFRNAKGTLNCRLFTEASGFPDGEGARTVRAAITGTQATCVFDELPPGAYAVAVVHDENGNGRLDKNFLGIPTEGYGVSNNRTYAASSPKWDESRFTVAAREPAVLRVNLRY